MERMHTLIHDPSLNKFCDVHLRLNELHFESYMLTHGKNEEQDTRADNTDFYMVSKTRSARSSRAVHCTRVLMSHVLTTPHRVRLSAPSHYPLTEPLVYRSCTTLVPLLLLVRAA